VLFSKTNVLKFAGIRIKWGLSEEWLKGVPFRISLMVYDYAHTIYIYTYTYIYIYIYN
jgi:hypothetical protein